MCNVQTGGESMGGNMPRREFVRITVKNAEAKRFRILFLFNLHSSLT